MKYKEASPFDKLTLKQNKIQEIKTFIDTQCSTQEKEVIQLINQLIDGFESPLGMELLATIDFLIVNNLLLKDNETNLIEEVSNWNDRKAKLMKPYYIQVSLKRLKQHHEILYT